MKPAAAAPALVGIVNLTADSFSDGGRFLDPRAARAHGEALLADGADWLDLGAESSNPDGHAVPVDEQIRRLTPLVRHFSGQGARVSVDTHRPEVMRAVLDAGAGMINDITGLADPAALAVLAASSVPIVVMHARTGVGGARADREVRPHAGIVDEIAGFFRARLAALAAAGIARERVLLDPGMGFFLGSNPEPSLAVLGQLAALRDAPGIDRPLYVSCSRKSFIGHLLASPPRPPAERGAGTLAAELWALEAGASYVRTHDVRALGDAWRIWRAIAAMRA